MHFSGREAEFGPHAEFAAVAPIFMIALDERQIPWESRGLAAADPRLQQVLETG